MARRKASPVVFPPLAPLLLERRTANGEERAALRGQFARPTLVAF